MNLCDKISVGFITTLLFNGTMFLANQIPLQFVRNVKQMLKLMGSLQHVNTVTL